MSAQPDWMQQQEQDERERFATVMHRVEQGMAGAADAEFINNYVDDLWHQLEIEESKNGN